MTEQHDGQTLRAAQETAVRDVLERLTTIPGLQRQVLAAEVVDAVLAAGPVPSLLVDVPAELSEDQAEQLKARFREAMAQPQRITVLPGPTPDALDQAEARGYATAVANLRDGERYEHWWIYGNNRPVLGVDNLRHRHARYLEAVGPGAAEVVHACPPGDEALTPCCGRSPFNLTRLDRLTSDPALVTCSRPQPGTDETVREAGRG